MIILTNEDRTQDIIKSALQDACDDAAFPYDSAEAQFDAARELPREVETGDADALYEKAYAMGRDVIYDLQTR